MSDGALRGVAVATLVFVSGFLWFLAQSFTLAYEATVAASAKKSLELSAFIDERTAFPQLTHHDLDILFVGDIMLSRAVGSTTVKSGDFSFPFIEAAEVLKEADLTFGNFENPMSDRGENQGSIYSFRVDPRMVDGLKMAGFDVLSLANNHIWDYGREALLDTISHLQGAGIKTIGAGKNYEEANASATFDLYGTKIAFLGYSNFYPKSLWAESSTPGISSFEEEQVMMAVEKAKESNDLVIVSVHWGEEYKPQSNETQKTWGRRIVEAGADMVIGHHPHVVQEWEEYRGGWIFYSLGNFVFDQTQSEETMRGLAVRARVRGGRIVSLESIPVQIPSSFQPSFGNPQRIR
ncbi:MAG: CapA family protein [Anaplasmataceae bacterium]|nr:CapA family protein [Anaplasmataceae bacterium]